MSDGSLNSRIIDGLKVVCGDDVVLLKALQEIAYRHVEHPSAHWRNAYKEILEKACGVKSE